MRAFLSPAVRTARWVRPCPVRAKLIRRRQKLAAYGWSSYGEYLKAPSRRAGWLRVDRLLGEWGIPKDSPAGRRHFERCLEARRVLVLNTMWMKGIGAWTSYKSQLVRRAFSPQPILSCP